LPVQPPAVNNDRANRPYPMISITDYLLILFVISFVVLLAQPLIMSIAFFLLADIDSPRAGVVQPIAARPPLENRGR